MGRQPRPERNASAIIILEAPWDLYSTDSNKASVLPFFEGIAKLYDDVHVFHANFYDIDSFRLAFNHLAKAIYRNTIVYIAAHGYEGEIAGSHVGEYVEIIREKAKSFNISGVVVGACYSADKEGISLEQVEGSALRWCVGYCSTVNWMTGTMIDMSIIDNLLNLYSSIHQDPLSDDNEIVKCFQSALSPFNDSYFLGHYYHKKKKAKLRDSLRIIIQASGQGKRARLLAEEVWTRD